MKYDARAIREIAARVMASASSEGRNDLLSRACRDNAELRAVVESLVLQEESQREPVVASDSSQSIPILNATATVDSESGPHSGQVIGGRYQLMEAIGEGGMGTVWVAEQKQPVRRRVAIKLIKSGMDSRAVLARFDAERQALALMDHPNIAKVYDGGTTPQGRPYFVMEFVSGLSLTDYCDQNRMSVTNRIKLFFILCHAVQHAHQKALIQRDLKPSNILVHLQEDQPAPRVIDFGLAKAIGQLLTTQTVFTAAGAMVGTPMYMSPEQAGHSGLDIDTRADIYSLGIILYELLTGSTPLERERVRNASALEVLRMIKDDESPRPSSRLSSSNSLPQVTSLRGVDQKELQSLIAGDLDWIVIKAIEKDRTRRYWLARFCWASPAPRLVWRWPYGRKNARSAELANCNKSPISKLRCWPTLTQQNRASG